MPGYNECGIYDPECRNKTCEHPTNPRNQGVQCRTRTEQRPCGSRSCERPECSGARLSAEAFKAGAMTGIMKATNHGTNNGSTPLETTVVKSREEEPTYDLTGLTRANLRTLERALRARERDARVGDDYAELRKLRDMVCALL